MFGKKVLKAMVALMILVFAATILGCGQQAEKPATPAAPETAKIQIAGSTSVQPLSEELAKAFMAKDSKVRIDVAGGGSGAGIKAAQTGSADIGASSRELKQEEKNVKEFVIALDGIAVIVHKENKVEDLKIEDVKKIFLGEVTDWSEISKSSSGPIRLYTREEGSGTRGAFEELILGKDAAGKELKISEKANVQNSTGAVRTAVAGDKNGIGYISVGSINEAIKPLKINGVEATENNVKANTYKISRPFIYMTQKEPAGAVKAFIDWVLSPEGQAVVKEHFIPIK